MQSALVIAIFCVWFTLAQAVIQRGGPSTPLAASGSFHGLTSRVKYGGLLSLPPRTPLSHSISCLASKKKTTGSSVSLLQSKKDTDVARDLSALSTIKPERIDKQGAKVLLKNVENVFNSLQMVAAYCIVAHSKQFIGNGYHYLTL